MQGQGESRRRLLRALGVGAGAVTGGFLTVGSHTAGVQAAECTPGHEDGDAACRQIFDDRTSLTPFDAADTTFPIGIKYPCGWSAGLTDFENRIQLNVTRSGIGEAEAYVDIQVRASYEPVEEGLIEDIRSDGDYEAVEYTFAGTSRTGLVSSRDSAQFGTVGHAAIPVGQQFAHVELVSTLKGAECTLDPRPDWWVVHDMLATIGANPDSRFREVAPAFTRAASVSASDQRVADTSYPDFVVDSVDLPEGGFAVVKRAADGSILGASAMMADGEHRHIRITLDEALATGDTELVVVVYRDTNDDNQFESDIDTPYTVAGAPVRARAIATVQEDTTVRTETPAGTPTLPPQTDQTPTPTPTSEATRSTSTTTTEGTETSGGTGRGMGPLTALAALLAVAYRAFRTGTEEP